MELKLKNLDDWRPEYELYVITAALIAGVPGGFVLFLYGDSVRVSGTWGNTDLLAFGLVLAAVSLACLVAVRRYWSRVRVARLDLQARTYALVVGVYRGRVTRTGGFDDFACVRLTTKIRKVYGGRNVRLREFWCVSLHWKEKGRDPFCLQEVAGDVVDPPPPRWLARINRAGEYHQAQALLARWAADLGVPAVDETLAAKERRP